MLYQKHCPGCFENKSSLPVCPRCGYDESAARSAVFLPHGLMLRGQYRVGRVLGQPGGFGITYIGWDVYLQQRVAIKEYLPRSIAERRPDSPEVIPHNEEGRRSFEAGKEQFLREARIVAKFDHPNIVRVRNFFNANGTAYLVMDYYEGMSLGDYLGSVRSRIEAEVSVGLLLPVLDGLDYVHQRGVVHRDLKPHNIYLATIGRPIVLDFGAARQAVGDLAPTLSLMLTEGYAPIEQYQRNAPQGPYTDVYGVAATLYRMIAGVAPPMALDRVGRDPLDPAGWNKIPGGLRPALKKALAVRPEERFDSAAEFSLALGAFLAQAPNPLDRPTPLTMADEPQRRGRPTTAPSTPSAPGESPRAPDITPANFRGSAAAPPAARASHRSGSVRTWILSLLLLAVSGLWLIQQRGGLPLQPLWFALTVPHPALVTIRAGALKAADGAWPVAAFRIGRDEVTQAEFRAFLQRSGYRNPAWATHPCEAAPGHDPRWERPGWSAPDDEPVVCASYDDALAYTAWLSSETGRHYRLPTETEWEYAARGGSSNAYWWGVSLLPGAAVCADCGVTPADHPAAVGARSANPFGLRDVSGNVAELTCSAYAPTMTGTAQHCASGTPAAVAVRGGAWSDTLDRLDLNRRAAFATNRRSDWVGFRVVADAP